MFKNSKPKPFDGGYEQAHVNRLTHWFDGIDGRCMECDARPSHKAADYPCGASVPRLVTMDDGEVVEMSTHDEINMIRKMNGKDPLPARV